MITLYNGPVVRSDSSPTPSHQLRLTPRLFIFSSTPEYWVLGSISLAAACLSVSVWNVIQAGTVKQQHTEVMTVLSFYSLVGTIQSAVVSLIAGRNSSAWRIKLNMELLLIVLSAIFGSVTRSHVHVWYMRLKGTFYVLLFKPVGIVIVTTVSTIFFGDSLRFGRLVIMLAPLFSFRPSVHSFSWGLETESSSMHGKKKIFKDMHFV